MYLYRLKLWPVFLIGFGIGFLLALILFAAQDLFNNISICQKSSLNLYSTNRNDLKWFMSDTWIKREITIQSWKDSTNMTYSKWLSNRKLRSKNIDMDTYLYGPESREELEAEWLKSNIHITCIVFVKKVKLARSIQDTWGKHCNKIYFFGQVKDPKMPIINFDTKLVSSWQLLCEAFRYVWKSSETLEWLIFVKDDTLVVLENLRYMLGPLNHTQDHYLGHAVTLWGQPYNVADAGYVISAGVLRKLIKMFDNSEKCIISGKYWKQEDYYLAKHLASMGIYPSDTRDQYLRGTFHGYSLQSLLWGIVKTGVYWTRALYPVKNECCSFISVTFNVGETEKMHTLNYLLYHFHVLKRKAVFGSRKAAISISDKDVWRVALEDEFNITNLNNISSEMYYEIWHAKYSEPGQLISKNYQAND
ncbi:C1GALT1-specific chaperone 1 isoform X1 [Bombus terrestris]|uniref:N-acetylgalactosaminide beta-1,3-galactosyltransferase n=1 Tax=Bombus terrestris TaxID=30195 RepID=A0A9B2JXP2_BOMTE|nr:C1GALT1-specific chaperone 1 isoform X1 [Bombus terrestris]